MVSHFSLKHLKTQVQKVQLPELPRKFRKLLQYFLQFSKSLILTFECEMIIISKCNYFFEMYFFLDTCSFEFLWR